MIKELKAISNKLHEWKFSNIQQNNFDRNLFFSINKNTEGKSHIACKNNWRNFTNNETNKKSQRKYFLPWETFAKLFSSKKHVKNPRNCEYLLSSSINLSILLKEERPI